MIATPVSPAEVFAEALGVVPVVHTPASAKRALAIGPPAVAVLSAAGRYPFMELVYLGEDAPAAVRQPRQADKRLRAVNSILDLPADWKADVIAIAVPGIPDEVLSAARRSSHAATVVAVAVDRYASGPAAKRQLERHWRTVIPYREHLPAAQLYLLASDTTVRRERPIPSWTRRLSEGYIPAMFRFPKDEHVALNGPGTPPSRPTPARTP